MAMVRVGRQTPWRGVAAEVIPVSHGMEPIGREGLVASLVMLSLVASPQAASWPLAALVTAFVGMGAVVALRGWRRRVGRSKAG